MHIVIGCDHRGLTLKHLIMNLLTEIGHSYQDFGCYDVSPVDYPDVAQEVAEAVTEGRFQRGILICSTGIGMSIAANKIRGIRAALCHDVLSARRARQHNDANIFCLGQEVLEQGVAQEIVKAYLAAEFEGSRHQGRLQKIEAMENFIDNK